jgi:HD-like signal output (HDOD) protein/nitrogen-specific signal transduction histidine kinase
MMLELGSSPKSIIESVEMGWLPSPPHIFSKLLDICHDPDSSIAELTGLISTDAVLTSKIIMAVNSAAFAIKQPVKDLNHAVTLLGHDQVKSMVLTSAIQQLFAGLINSRKKTVCDAWLDSLYCAEFAREIADALNYEHPQDAYMAGLLRDFGRVVFDTKFHEQYLDILNSETEDFIVSKEISKFGVSHSELGACIIEQWPSLSPAIADAARFHHEEEQQLRGCDMLCQIVAEASKIAWQWSRFGVADIKWRSVLIGDDELKNIYTRVRHKMSQTTATLGISLPKSASLTQDQFSSDLENVTIRLGRKIRDASLIKVISSEETHLTRINSPRNLLLKVAQELQLIFSISDVALLLPDPKNADYLILYELNHVNPVSKFSVDNPNSKIIRSYLEKSIFWIEPEKTQDEITPISDRQIIRRLKHDIAFSLPLGNGNQVIGTVVIGSNKVQKSYLANQAEFISGYLKNIVDMWLKNNQVVQQEAFDDQTNKQQEQKDIDKLVHEISNPLSVIGNYIDILKLNAESDGRENNKEIEILKEELQRIRNIVLNFKDAKNSESQAVFLNDELKMCIPLYVKSISDIKEVQIKWRLDESDSEIKITRDALRQIILNLVKNAVEAQNVDAKIIVSSHHFVNIDGTAFAQFSISDRGRGVDAITRQILFSPLKSTKEGAGRGLGLSVVAEILGSFNGQIKYMENEVGGASFEVLIPLS